MNLLWPLFAWHQPARRKPALKPQPRADAELTRAAAALLRGVGCSELANKVSVRWSARLTSTAGIARPAQSSFILNPRLRDFPAEIDRTLRHELAHLVASQRAQGRRILSHGPQWRRACAELGIPGEPRCHTLPLPRRRMAPKHLYRCPACETVLRRVRPIKARHKLACLDCCRQHARGRFDPRFEFIKISSR